ncbi:MAG: Ig-like domain repeat protein [Caldilineaceae bacterium]
MKDSSVVCNKNQQIHTIVSSEYNRDTATNEFTHTKFADPYSSSELSSSNKECEANCSISDPPTPVPPPPNRSPNSPSLNSPSDSYISRDGRAPTLCWNNNGDPDGDQVQFYAEVFDSERSANSGWISSTCWRPGNLDGNYFNYQWRVKARDNRNAESSWSGSRRFTVEPENRPPTISFNTANGNTSSEINSRDQSWTFTGTAGDPEGRLNRVEFKCEGDSCNATQNIGNNGNWSFQRDGLTGRNRIWFTACDDRQCVDSRAVTLRVDLAPPATTADANGQSNPSGWFRGPVEVKLRAQDGATGSASVGVRELRYRIDNGDWQSSSGDSKSLTINTDGAHTVEYYAVDHLDNQESPAKRIAFQIDASPPSAPGAATETHGVGNDQWQKSVGAPEFTWGAASDSTSGLQHYELYFGPDANSDQIQSFVAANADRRWTPLPNGVRTGVYYLRARARDLAGNYSAWSTLFTFRYDVTPPGNPTAATHAANLPSGSWQRTSATADFTWTPPSDEGSGVKGYYVYWGDQPEGKDESTGAFRTSAAYGAAGPLCAASQSCTGYLRVRSVDYVDNFAGDWSTLFALHYDGAAPTLDFTINGGVTQTAQTLVSLNLNATDQGSGVRDARSFASDNWSAWEPYQIERIETIPAIGRQSWPVYVQVRDAVGWESAVISQSVYFEVNRPQPKSANFWLFTGMVNGGNGSHVSANYQGRSSVGQSVDTAPIASPNYILRGGYQVASQALPLQVPEHDEFTFINGVFASGIVNDTMQSAQYRLASSIGQMGLPANQTTLSSAGYQLQPGFLAAVPARQSSPTPPPTPTPGPTPTPVPPQGCEFATLSINQGALFTNTPKVTLDLCGPNAAEMKVSNDGSFANAPWEPYRTSKGWTLTTLGQNVIARLVQARFKDRDGLTHHYAVDDIIYDPTAPSGAVAVNDPVPAALLGQLLAAEITQAAAGQATAAMESFTVGDMTYLRRLGKRVFDTPVPLLSTVKAEGVAVYLIAQDDNSGLAQMQLSENANGDGAAWQAYDGLVQWMPSGGDGEKQLYARFGDSAGNASGVYSATVVIDSQPPLGGINILEEIIGANTVNLQLYLAAEDNLSSIPAIRLSHDPAFADAPWQPFAAEMKWPIQVSANENEKTIYVQFRDAAGNISQTYSDTVLIDRQPPVMYVEVAAGDSLARQVNLYAYDELSALTSMRLSNDPMLIDAVVTLSYSDTAAWTFDERRVVWVQVDDSAGNRSDPYPAYAALPGDIPNPPVEQRVYLPLINR